MSRAGGKGCQSGIKGVEREDVPQVGEEQHSCCAKLSFRPEVRRGEAHEYQKGEVLCRGGTKY